VSGASRMRSDPPIVWSYRGNRLSSMFRLRSAAQSSSAPPKMTHKVGIQMPPSRSGRRGTESNIRRIPSSSKSSEQL
jgi:hypothetical protein